ncbi:tumor necrosis factor receptor superfamily member 5 [Tachysurus fulvidraco]|uniref:tumor necrosis factor receptor superfamily member 5 n=1 Tax=Tachysurus fulvidraco TaxID=1234273 RepID=UPI001FEDECE6|nr:tumor necrosis factor receptor superfamily member 5 [Tachysurus fulvidraco]
MKQSRITEMHLKRVFILLVLSVVAESCDTETHYMKDEKCCKMCEPGTRLKIEKCEDPLCEECEEGEYQDHYNNMSTCKRQPSCDLNLYFEKGSQSKIEYSPCKCIAGHHCVNQECVACARNTICQAGEKISKSGTQMEDLVCEACPAGTFSNQESALTCQPWTECSSVSVEINPGSPTSDRICGLNRTLLIVTPVVVIAVLVIIGLFACIYIKGRTGSISFVRKLQAYCVRGNKLILTPIDDIVHVENAPEQQPRNQPQEDTEDLLKPDPSLVPGISENGMPVIQDHSKSFLISETETEPESISVHF